MTYHCSSEEKAVFDRIQKDQKQVTDQIKSLESQQVVLNGAVQGAVEMLVSQKQIDREKFRVSFDIDKGILAWEKLPEDGKQ